MTDREFKEVSGGRYDDNGFYITPNGSFWDPDGVYFNREGLDKHGGYYDDNFEYHPGRGWIPELMCYEDEKEEVFLNLKGVEEFDGEEDEIFENIDYEKIMNEEMYNEDKEQEQIRRLKFKTQIKCESIPEPVKMENLFNKIPDDKRPRGQEDLEIKKVENKVDVDSLFQ